MDRFFVNINYIVDKYSLIIAFLTFLSMFNSVKP